MDDYFEIPEIWAPLSEIEQEVINQEEKWGIQNHKDGTGPNAEFLSDSVLLLADILKERNDRNHVQNNDNWATILLEEVFEALGEDDLDKLAHELTQIAAVAISWKMNIARRLRAERSS